jgi:hypothetical protein
MLEGLAALACERLKRPRVRVVGGRSVLGRCRFGGPLSIEVLPDRFCRNGGSSVSGVVAAPCFGALRGATVLISLDLKRRSACVYA